MTNRHRERLVQLAKEVIEADKPEIIIGTKDENNQHAQTKMLMYYLRVNYLLGYILALEELAQEPEEEEK